MAVERKREGDMSERPAGLVEIHRAELSEVSEPKIPDGTRLARGGIAILERSQV
jgi:hypothetical protein